MEIPGTKPFIPNWFEYIGYNIVSADLHAITGLVIHRPFFVVFSITMGAKGTFAPIAPKLVFFSLGLRSVFRSLRNILSL